MQRRKADLGAVADQKKDESESEHARLELALDRVEVGPKQCGHAFAAESFLRGEVQQDGAKECLCDANAAKDEVFPGGFQAGAGAIERNQQDRGEGCGFHRDPQKAHVVGEQSQQHRGHEELVHGVVEAQAARGQAAVQLLDAHVGAREERGGEAYEGCERDQKDIEGIDEELVVEDQDRAVTGHAHHQERGGDQRREADGDIQFRRSAFRAEEREQQKPEEGQTQYREQFQFNPP